MHNSDWDEKEVLYSHWNSWRDMKEEIEKAYKQNDPSAAVKMTKAIENYLLMLSSIEISNPSDPQSTLSLLEPLNGKERLQFIRERIAGYYAYVQLDSLYTEAMKKAVSQLAMRNKTAGRG